MQKSKGGYKNMKLKSIRNEIETIENLQVFMHDLRNIRMSLIFLEKGKFNIKEKFMFRRLYQQRKKKIVLKNIKESIL